ncbi:MAG: YcaO-like family protein [Pseudobacteriovorax sp.]|nr:YcaO-like family protein [Pseudobacteriovorax sp.]
MQDFVNWIKTNADMLSLHSNIVPTCSPIEGFNLTASKITVNGVQNAGSALSFDLSNATYISICEALERTVFQYNEVSTTTNGIAFHTDKNSGVQNSIKEAIERDRFYCHYLTSTPYYDMTDSFYIENPDFIRIRESLSQVGVEVKIGAMRFTENYEPAIAVMVGTNENLCSLNGFIVGLGCSNRFNNSARSAFLELIKSSVPFFTDVENKFNLITDNVYLEKARDLEDHRHISLYTRQKHRVARMFSNDYTYFEDFISRRNSIEESINVKILDFPNEIEDCPGYCFYAYSDKLQNFIIGETSSAKINFGSLETFLGREVKFEEIELFPPPLS